MHGRGYLSNRFTIVRNLNLAAEAGSRRHVDLSSEHYEIKDDTELDSDQAHFFYRVSSIYVLKLESQQCSATVYPSVIAIALHPGPAASEPTPLPGAQTVAVPVPSPSIVTKALPSTHYHPKSHRQAAAGGVRCLLHNVSNH
jgi:hypothetical protein